MGNCVLCHGFSGRREICYECAVVLWPRRKVNPGVKQLQRKLLPVPPPIPKSTLVAAGR